MIKLIIFDYGGTIYNPQADQLYFGTKKLLQTLRDANFKLVLVSIAGDKNKRLNDFKRFHLENYFEIMKVAADNKLKIFVDILKKFNISPKQCLVVGDYIQSEIKEGNKIGATTIWIKNGEFPNILPLTKQEKPDHKIESLTELVPLIGTF